MSSLLDDIDVTLTNGDLEVFKILVEAKLKSKDEQIKHLLHRIQKLEDKIDILEQEINSKLDIGRFEYEIAMRCENYRN